MVMAVFSAGRCWIVLFVVFVLVCGMVGADPSGAVDGSSDGSGVAAVGGFDDVGGGGVHAPAVEALEADGVFEGTGCGDGLFCPGEPILRWVIAVWLIRVLDAAPAEGADTRFSDVDAGEWWAPYLETLADLGVTAGCATGPLRFCPHESVTRAQMASFLVRAFDLDEAPTAGFVDTAGNTHEANIDALAGGRVTAGCATGPLRYCPAKAVTRAQMATFLARATGLVALPDGDSGGGQEPEPVVDEVVAGFDPFTTPTLSDLDLDRLAVAVATLDETVECPPVVAPDSLDDVAEVVRIADGCLIVEYEPLRGRTVAEVREALSGDLTVHAVGVPPRDVYQASTTDSLRHNQWFLDKDAINAEVLWDSWPTGSDVIVAVIDDGVDWTHPDLDANVLHIGDACHRVPNGGHGTHVAGIVAAERNNDGAVVGVAPNAKILPIKIHFGTDFSRYFDALGVLQKIPRDPTCHGDVPTLTVAISRAVNEGADVINMSLRWSLEQDAKGQDTVELAIRAATMNNVVAVTSAGNCGAPDFDPKKCRRGRHERARPAVYPGVIAVAATDENNLRAVYSTSNRDVDIAAPGGGSPRTVTEATVLILSTWPDDDTLEEDERCEVASATGTRTCWTRGTSMAAPVVSGVVAHMKAHYPDATVNEIQYALYSTALNTDSSSANFRNDYGHGFINPVAAIGALRGLELGKDEYTDVSAGQSHSCGLRTNGTIDCWGNNDYGQTDVPEGIFKKLAAGANHTCGVRLKDGAIVCWGADKEGQAKGTPFIPLGPYTDVAAGQFHTCGLRTDNTITCWGAFRENKGQTKPPAGNFYAVSAGRLHTCGIQRPATRGITDGGGAVKCWGDNTYNQTSETPTGKFIDVSAGGYHTCGRRPELTIECWGNTAHGLVDDIPPGKFRSVSAGWFHTCSIQQTTAKAISGPVKCWGRNAFGRTDAPSDDNFTAITAGNFHTCGILDSETKPLTRNLPDHPTLTYDHPIRSRGTINCWGNNNHNQTDAPAPGKSTTDTATITAPITHSNAISAGEDHTCAIRTDSTIECWGADLDGQATPPAGVFTAVSVGDRYTCGLRAEGTVECWGGDWYGQATPPAGVFTAISAGYYHSCGIRTDSTVECWGANEAGQATPPAGTFTAVSADLTRTCGIRSGGTVECWGDLKVSSTSESGETELSDWSPPSGTFVAVTATCGIRTDGTVECWDRWGWYDDEPGGRVTAMSDGLQHTCGLRTDGTVECWGANEAGQATPPAGTFAAIAPGGEHTCGIKTDGTVVCWGYNDGRATPPGGTFAAVSAGPKHSCGLKADGTVECWGRRSDRTSVTTCRDLHRCRHRLALLLWSPDRRNGRVLGPYGHRARDHTGAQWYVHRHISRLVSLLWNQN